LRIIRGTEMELDLERSDTFTVEYDKKIESYNTMSDDGILDEEHVHWRVFLTRVFLFFLLLVTIICCALEEISQRFLFLAVIFCALLVFLIFVTFVDLSPFLVRFYNCVFGKSTSNSTSKSSGAENLNDCEQGNTTNPLDLRHTTNLNPI
jgi:hypothetical protein